MRPVQIITLSNYSFCMRKIYDNDTGRNKNKDKKT